MGLLQAHLLTSTEYLRHNMANTYELIESKTLSSSNLAGVTFSTIPQTFDDLILITSIRSDRSGVPVDGVTGYVNGDNSNQMSGNVYYGAAGGGAAYSSNSDAPLNAVGGTGLASVFANGYWYFPRYKDTSINRVWIGSGNSANSTTNTYGIYGGGWKNTTNAITSITITAQGYPATNLISGGSSFYLYGIKNA